jgi:hypothetical protein
MVWQVTISITDYVIQRKMTKYHDRHRTTEGWYSYILFTAVMVIKRENNHEIIE